MQIEGLGCEALVQRTCAFNLARKKKLLVGLVHAYNQNFYFFREFSQLVCLYTNTRTFKLGCPGLLNACLNYFTRPNVMIWNVRARYQSAIAGSNE